ncbi:hypothetical protein, partial [Adlercreutzia sp. ZJ305]
MATSGSKPTRRKPNPAARPQAARPARTPQPAQPQAARQTRASQPAQPRGAQADRAARPSQPAGRSPRPQPAR